MTQLQYSHKHSRHSEHLIREKSKDNVKVGTFIVKYSIKQL